MSKELLQQTSTRLMQVIAEAKEKFKNISSADWGTKSTPAQWSKKEILGHLIDSAANNHLRFIRAQLADAIFTGNSYEQDFFVSSQHYNEVPETELIDLWYAYNRHLSNVIANINPAKLNVSCHIGTYGPVPFSFVITDYVDHMEHHLGHVCQY